MTKTNGLMMTLGAVLVLGVSGYGQTVSPPEGARPATPAVTISVTEGGVRFVGLGSLRQMRLEVFGADGGTVYNSDFHAGSVRDWGLEDKGGQRLVDGTYLCVVSIRDLSGKLITKQGSVVLQNGRASLQMNDGETARSVEPEKALTPVADSANAAVALIGHDGRNGQLVSTRGGFSFRAGDFFGGKDQELMRLTPLSNAGDGTARARLDIAGTIRAAQGIEFADGTVQTTGLSGRTDTQGNIVPNTTGMGTQGRLAKWTDSVGTLGDSLLNENGNLIELKSLTAGGVNPTITNPNNVPNFAQFQFYPATGPNTNMSFATVPRGTGVSGNRAQIAIFGTDLIADSANYEFAALRARGTDFVFGTGHSGAGLNRPFMLAAGFLADNLTNNGQLYLDTTGNVGIGTTDPQTQLDVGGNLNVTGNATISGNISGQVSGHRGMDLGPRAIDCGHGGQSRCTQN